MAVRTGVEFEIESITSNEVKVIGGTAKTWGFLGLPGSGQYVQASDEWERAWRPKIGGWIVFMYDPGNPGRHHWPEYESPTKHAKRVKPKLLKHQAR